MAAINGRTSAARDCEREIGAGEGIGLGSALNEDTGDSTSGWKVGAGAGAGTGEDADALAVLLGTGADTLAVLLGAGAAATGAAEEAEA